MAKEPQELKWVENLLADKDVRRKSMFGGFAYYINDRLSMLIFENPGDHTYRNHVYPYEIWNGCMFPLEREYHEKALLRFPFLITHPVLSKWLYLPLNTENFDELVAEVTAQIKRPNSLWGSLPKKRAKISKSENLTKKIDTKKPRMFSDVLAKPKHQNKKCRRKKTIST